VPGDDCFDIFGHNPLIDKARGRHPGVRTTRVERAATRNLIGTAVNQKGLPAVVYDQIRGVALEAIARADLDQPAIGGTKYREEIQEDPVLPFWE
jgi:hypothetical protein